MISIFTGIMTLFNTTPNDLNTAIGGRMYSRWAPQNAALPYCVFTLVANSTDEILGNETFDDSLIQFSYFHDGGPAALGTIIAYHKAIFDNATLAVSGHTHHFMKRKSERLLPDPMDGIDHYSLDYEVLVES